eukprot:TRINITY_DN31284_c1_g1_i2.p1 TRINITY_DN31284_c1_g1~~TRINITY_DN31284_c1_g1_i2.p1  ORF type:complete len:517 (+),score=86.96 TRINITY_DN31284_c1_g1_i2:96-1646(+)
MAQQNSQAASFPPPLSPSQLNQEDDSKSLSSENEWQFIHQAANNTRQQEVQQSQTTQENEENNGRQQYNDKEIHSKSSQNVDDDRKHKLDQNFQQKLHKNFTDNPVIISSQDSADTTVPIEKLQPTLQNKTKIKNSNFSEDIGSQEEATNTEKDMHAFGFSSGSYQEATINNKKFSEVNRSWQEAPNVEKDMLAIRDPAISSGSYQEATNMNFTQKNNVNIDDESNYSVGQFCWRVANFGISIVQIFAIIAVIFLSVGYYFWNQEVFVQKPMIALQEFADLQERRQGLKLDQSQLEKLPVEQMHFFASAACVHGDFQQVSVALEKQLKSAPKQVREDILDQALIEGVSVQNSRQDAAVDVENQGKAHAYLAFYSTQHIPSALAEPQYSSCVMVAGMEFSVAEELASWEVQTDYKNLGYEDCDCGVFSCRKCPIIKEITTKRPVFKRHQLTFLDHKKLHQEMQRLAVQKSKDLTSGTSIGPWWQFVPMMGSSQPRLDDKNKQDDSTWDFREDPFTAP